MAKSKGSPTTKNHILSKPKKTSIGRSVMTKLSATSRNGRKKRYKGQGS